MLACRNQSKKGSGCACQSVTCGLDHVPKSHLADFQPIEGPSKHQVRNDVGSHEDAPLPDVRIAVSHDSITLDSANSSFNLGSHRPLPVCAQIAHREPFAQHPSSLTVLVLVGHLEDAIRALPSLDGAEKVVEIRLGILGAETMDFLEARDVCNVHLVGSRSDERPVFRVQLMQMLGLPELDQRRIQRREAGEFVVPGARDRVEG